MYRTNNTHRGTGQIESETHTERMNLKNGKRTDGSDAFQHIRYAKTDAQTHGFDGLRMLRAKDRHMNLMDYV